MGNENSSANINANDKYNYHDPVKLYLLICLQKSECFMPNHVINEFSDFYDSIRIEVIIVCLPKKEKAFECLPYA